MTECVFDSACPATCHYSVASISWIVAVLLFSAFCSLYLVGLPIMANGWYLFFIGVEFFLFLCEQHDIQHSEPGVSFFLLFSFWFGMHWQRGSFFFSRGQIESRSFTMFLVFTLFFSTIVPYRSKKEMKSRRNKKDWEAQRRKRSWKQHYALMLMNTLVILQMLFPWCAWSGSDSEQLDLVPTNVAWIGTRYPTLVARHSDTRSQALCNGHEQQWTNRSQTPMTLVVVSDLLESRELNSITLSLWINCGDVRMFEGKSDHCSR